MIQKNVERMIAGTALALAASAILPIAKTVIGPLAASGAQGGVGLYNKARSAVQRAREEVEDIIAEAQFERMKRRFDQEIAMLDGEE